MAVVVDHKTPIHMGGSLHDPENLQPLCAECHRLKTAQEGKQREAKRGRYPTEGWVVVGAPAAGKTTRAQTHAGARDFIWDHDRVLRALNGDEWANDPTPDALALGFMVNLRRAVLDLWRNGWIPGRLWWLTTSMEEANAIRAEFRTVQLLVLNPGIDEITRRINERTYLTEDQRNNLLRVARNVTATIEASGYGNGGNL